MGHQIEAVLHVRLPSMHRVLQSFSTETENAVDLKTKFNFLFSRGQENNNTNLIFRFSLYLQWTYCLAAFVVVGTAVWFYFITQSIKSVTYAPTILVGAGTSAMIVMSLTYLTDLIGEDKVCTLSLTIGAFSATCLSQTIQTTPIQSMLRPL